jgi:hypothetical protein
MAHRPGLIAGTIRVSPVGYFACRIPCSRRAGPASPTHRRGSKSEPRAIRAPRLLSPLWNIGRSGVWRELSRRWCHRYTGTRSCRQTLFLVNLRFLVSNPFDPNWAGRLSDTGHMRSLGEGSHRLHRPRSNHAHAESAAGLRGCSKVVGHSQWPRKSRAHGESPMRASIFTGSASRSSRAACSHSHSRIGPCRTAERPRAISNRVRLPGRSAGHRMQTARSRTVSEPRDETTSAISRLPKKKPGLVMLWPRKTITNTRNIITERCPEIETGHRRRSCAVHSQFANGGKGIGRQYHHGVAL